MKYVLPWLTALLLLAGCQRAPDTAAVWQCDLPDGAAAAFSNCAISEGEAAFYPQAGGEGYTLPCLTASDGTPVLSVQGLDAEEITVLFAVPEQDGYRPYDLREPLPRVDYVLTEEEDGTLQYRFDTVYAYWIEAGGEQWLLCRAPIE